MATRLSGTLAARPDPNAAVEAFYFATDEGKVYENDGTTWTEREALDKHDVVGYLSGLDEARPAPNEALGWVYIATNTGARYESFIDGWFTLPPKTFLITDEEFGVRLSSVDIGDRLADLTKKVHILTTNGISEASPALVSLNQIVDVSFVGVGALFDLIERDVADCDVLVLDTSITDGSPILTTENPVFSAENVGRIIHGSDGIPDGATVLSYQSPTQVTLSDDCTETATGLTFMLCGGATEVILGTKTGFADGVTTGPWSQLCRLISSDKSYFVNFVPGSAGSGAYSIKMKELQ